MQHTEKEQREIKQSFADKRRRQMIMAAPMIAAMLAFFFVSEADGGTLFGLSPGVWGPLFIAAVIGSLAFSFKNWRCPACDRYLGKAISLSSCPKCGVALKD